MSFSLTGPLTFLTIVLEVSSRNSTLTWVTPPLEPVLPRTLITFAKITGVLESCSEKNERYMEFPLIELMLVNAPVFVRAFTQVFLVWGFAC